jgi:hypothetical protein
MVCELNLTSLSQLGEPIEVVSGIRILPLKLRLGDPDPAKGEGKSGR